jgi:hypothetical protein
MANCNRRGITISELQWPTDKPGFNKISEEWPSDLVTQALELVWRGYDLLAADILNNIDATKANKQIEKNINSLLQLRISRVMTRDEPFDVQHEVPEFETSYSDQAQPPSYDIAFILRANERIILPLEAKVLRTEKAISKYIKEIQCNFLTCRYAPFSSEAGMLGYLLKGMPEIAFNNIELAVLCDLSDHPDFSGRNHKTSDHNRTVPTGKKYPAKFRCHHLLLQVTKQASVKKATTKGKRSRST